MMFQRPALHRQSPTVLNNAYCFSVTYLCI